MLQPLAPPSSPPRRGNFFAQRFSPDEFMGRPFTLLVCGLLVQPLIYLLLGRALESGWSQNLDRGVDAAMAALRTHGLITPALWITYLGGPVMVTSATLIMLIVLWLRDKKSYLLPFCTGVIGCGLYTLLGKALFPRVRPVDAVYTTEKSLSFISGHAAQAITCYGFILYFLWRTHRARSGRAWVLLSGCLFIATLIFSRLYLSVHYASDVLSGMLLGTIWLVIAISISEWRFKHVAPEPPEGDRSPQVKWAIGGLLAAWLIIYIYTGSRFQAAALARPVAGRMP